MLRVAAAVIGKRTLSRAIMSVQLRTCSAKQRHVRVSDAGALTEAGHNEVNLVGNICRHYNMMSCESTRQAHAKLTYIHYLCKAKGNPQRCQSTISVVNRQS